MQDRDITEVLGERDGCLDDACSVSGEHTVGHHGLEALLDTGDEFLQNVAALDLVVESESGDAFVGRRESRFRFSLNLCGGARKVCARLWLLQPVGRSLSMIGKKQPASFFHLRTLRVLVPPGLTAGPLPLNAAGGSFQNEAGYFLHITKLCFMAFDFKKEYKEFYLPAATPAVVDVPPMNYIAIRGKGNPNDEDGEYKASLELLYGIAFTIKMSKMGDHRIEGYFDYVVPPVGGALVGGERRGG